MRRSSERWLYNPVIEGGGGLLVLGSYDGDFLLF